MKRFDVMTEAHSESIDITPKVRELIPRGMQSGLCVIFNPHTTAGITINEGADPNVQRDFHTQLDKMIPWVQSHYRHLEGNAAAHIKASLVGSSVVIIVEKGKLQLGTWQKIFFTEFDGPRHRKVLVSFIQCNTNL